MSDAGTGTVKRYHYDDSDVDGVLDSYDNCLGLANPDQQNMDRDKLGDACDDDADGDGVANAGDRCPTRRGNGSPDGCPAIAAARRAMRAVHCSTARGSSHARRACAARKRAAYRRALRQT